MSSSVTKRLNVEMFLELFEDMQFFMFVSVGDNRVRSTCNRYNISLMTRREVKETFDYLDMLTDEI